MADPSFSLTKSQIVRQALLMLGAIDTSEQPTSKEVSDASVRLNALINDLAPHCNVFATYDHTHTLTPGTQSYTVGNGKDIDVYRPYKLISARRKSSSSDLEVELWVESRQEYMRLPNKSTQAPPVLVYYQPKAAEGVLYVWPTGTSTWNKLVLTFQRPLDTLDATGDTLDMPQEWHYAITVMLAEALAPDYLNGIPQWLMAKAEQKRQQMLAHDTEDASLYIKPDLRTYRHY
jgi:hypothetical protein